MTAIHKTLCKRGLLGLMACGMCFTVLASEYERRVDLLDAYKQECSACHTAYSPAMLGAASWQRIMSGLDRHYGVDASLDAKTLTEVSRWLQGHAGTSRKVSVTPPEDRITRSAWFEREHRKVPDAVWKRASVRGPAQCAACHTRADQGDYDEDHVRIPR